MQPKELNVPLVRLHYVLSLEATNNLLFEFATMAPVLDRQRVIPERLKEVFNWGDELKTWFDYRNRVKGIYGRLYEVCVISLCSDIEYFFKSMFAEYGLVQGKGRGFFQRFDDVMNALEDQGFDLSGVSDERDNLREAFLIRHICIHNFGIVDDDFAAKVKSPVSVGEKIVIEQTNYRRFFDAYVGLLKNLDGQLVNLSK